MIIIKIIFRYFIEIAEKTDDFPSMGTRLVIVITFVCVANDNGSPVFKTSAAISFCVGAF